MERINRVDVTDAHIKELADKMQEIDKQSILLQTGLLPIEGLEESVANAYEASTWLVDGRVAAICGIRQITFLTDWAWPWIILEPEAAKKHTSFLLRSAKKWIEEKLERHGWLITSVYAEDKRAIRWLKCLGFTIYPPKVIGPKGALFMKAELKNVA